MANFTPHRRVLILCGDFMEHLQVMVPFQALKAYGVSVDAVCPGKNSGDICRTAVHRSSGHQTYGESRGHNFALNATFDKIVASNYDGLVIPGGRAPEYLAMDKSVLDLVNHFAESGKAIASIGHGQLILAAAGAIKDRKCTSYPALKPVLLAAGAHWVEPETMASCTVDVKIITAATYEGHPDFLFYFIKALGGTIFGFGKRILFLCGDYMEDYQVIVPFQSLQALKCHVDAVCPNKLAGDNCATAIHDFDGDQICSEKPGHAFTLTATFEGLDASSYDALVIPGGRAPKYLALNEDALKLVNEFLETGRPIAICHGKQIIDAANALQGENRTVYPAHVVSGGTYKEPDPIDRIISNGNVITGAGWPRQPEFVSQLMMLLGIRVSFSCIVAIMREANLMENGYALYNTWDFMNGYEL